MLTGLHNSQHLRVIRQISGFWFLRIYVCGKLFTLDYSTLLARKEKMKLGKPLKHVSRKSICLLISMDECWECLWFWCSCQNLLGSPISFNESLGVASNKCWRVFHGTPLNWLPTTDHTPYRVHEPQIRGWQWFATSYICPIIFFCRFFYYVLCDKALKWYFLDGHT